MNFLLLRDNKKSRAANFVVLGEACRLLRSDFTDRGPSVKPSFDLLEPLDTELKAGEVDRLFEHERHKSFQPNRDDFLRDFEPKTGESPRRPAVRLGQGGQSSLVGQNSTQNSPNFFGQRPPEERVQLECDEPPLEGFQ